MNLLTSKLPEKVRLGGKEYPIGWRFVDCMPIIMAMQDEGLTQTERYLVMLSRFYPDGIPEEQAEKAVQLAINFLDGGGATEMEEAVNGDEDDQYRLYSFSKDGNLIYSAFRSHYGIDLSNDTIHWWQFLQLFYDLPHDCRFCRIVALRQGWLDGTLSKEERELFDAMGEAARPPEQPMSEEKRRNAEEFLRLLEGGE